LITVITGFLGFITAGLLLYLVRKDHLHVAHGLGWTLAIFVSAMLGFAPGIFDTVAQTVGVAYAPVLGLSIAIAALLVKALLTDIEYTRLKVRQQRLIQKLSLLETELNELSGNPPLDD